MLKKRGQRTKSDACVQSRSTVLRKRTSKERFAEAFARDSVSCLWLYSLDRCAEAILYKLSAINLLSGKIQDSENISRNQMRLRICMISVMTKIMSKHAISFTGREKEDSIPLLSSKHTHLSELLRPNYQIAARPPNSVFNRFHTTLNTTTDKFMCGYQQKTSVKPLRRRNWPSCKMGR
jgi:hypothetical protein